LSGIFTHFNEPLSSSTPFGTFDGRQLKRTIMDLL
jgi:hypothetical protein